MAWTIDDGSAQFHIQLWTGDGDTPETITNDANAGDFQADLLWTKGRATAYEHQLYDSSRGAGTDKGLTPDTNEAEGQYSATYGYLSAFTSNGFTGTAGSSGQIAYFNVNAQTYVAWQWKAAGGSRTTFTESGANPGGGYQVNTTAGFSIVDYTGTGSAGTISHGLGTKPELIIVKNRDAAQDWAVYHQSNTAAPETDLLELNNGDATADATVWNDTAPTTSVFSVGTDARVNSDAVDYIAYCWTGVQGFSQFGTFYGSGGTNGPFLYTGFSPAFIIMKEWNNATGWGIWDDTRIGFNPRNSVIQPNTGAAEYTGASYAIDFLSNGFKIRHSDAAYNGNGDYYIYGAFGKVPEVTSGGVPATAR